MKKVIRRDDILGRYGGEEFALLLVNVSKESAYMVAEKIRKAVETNIFEFEGEVIPITISIGLQAFDNTIQSTGSFFALADEKLYQAKNNGRNNVVS